MSDLVTVLFVICIVAACLGFIARFYHHRTTDTYQGPERRRGLRR